MGDELKKIKLAAVQAASVHLDRDATVEKACALIREAGRAGAQVIGFPEGFIPAHPSWYTVRPATGKVSLGLAKRLFQNAVVVPSKATDRLSAAAREANITAVVGVCEKQPGTTGTLFNTQLFFGPDGTLLGKHQKLMPTVGERLVHRGGWGDTLKAFPAPMGKVSGLICGENANPLAVYALMTMYPVVHVAAWPAFVTPALDLGEIISAATRGLAYSMGIFVINSAGVLTDEIIDDYQPSAEERAFLEPLKDRGYASIVGPTGQIIAGPMGPGEGILYADVDLNDVIVPKMIHDYAGHYNRPDIFQVHINTAVPPAITRGPGAVEIGLEGSMPAADLMAKAR
ncbi:MAG: carbon-nitrogen hydrolase family protein [Rhodospirillales bacterium]|nr:carbon-nitrogen hydrolase family protein [Rhodospirillales bacterium]